MKIRELMTSPAYTVRPTDSLEQAAEILWQHDIGALPVVDDEGRVDAVITDRDICMGAMMKCLPLTALRVAETMSRDVVSCTPDEDVKDVVERMCEHQLHRVPVVDKGRKALGMLALNDLVNEGAHDKKLAPLAQQLLAATSRHRAKVPAVAAAAGKPKAPSAKA